MRCPIESEETSEVLLAYCARRLNPETTAIVERHLASCPACRKIFDGQRAVWEALDAWEAMPVALDFDRRLFGRIERDSSAPWWEKLAAPFGRGLVKRALPVAAAACLLVAAIGIMEPWGAPAVDSQAVPAIQADQVERTLEDLELLHAFSQEVRAQAQATRAL